MRVAAANPSLPLTHDGYRALCIEQNVNVYDGRGLMVQVRCRGVVSCARVVKISRTPDGQQLYQADSVLGRVWCRHDQVRACQGQAGCSCSEWSS